MFGADGETFSYRLLQTELCMGSVQPGPMVHQAVFTARPHLRLSNNVWLQKLCAVVCAECPQQGRSTRAVHRYAYI